MSAIAWEPRRRRVPYVLPLWRAMRRAPGPARATIYRHVRRDLEGRGYTLGELMLASGAIE